jgi:hypothetical protein
VRQDDLQFLLQRVPCPRIRLHLIGGQTFDLTDPEEVLLTRSTVEFLLPNERGREAVVSLLHVIWAEVISSD